jgi:hypothetical protein
VKQFWKTGVALLVLIGLGLYIWKYERGEVPEEDKDKILAVDKEQVTALSIDAPDTDEIRLVKEGDGWRVTAPFEAPADASAVDSLLSRLGDLEADEVVVETTQDLAQYGLADPSRTVTVTVEGEEAPLVVEFGGQTPGGSAVYARTPSSPRVYTVASFVETSFDKKPFDLRDRDLLHVKRADVRTLDVKGPEGDYALARTDAGDWAFTEPIATRAGRWSVDGLLGTLENLKMESVAAEDAESLEPYGLDHPARSVRLVLSDGTTRTLEIGGDAGGEDDGKLYAREKGSDLVAVIPGAIVTDLEKGMNELRAKKLLEVATYDTTGFDVVSDGVTRTYSKSTAEGDEGFDETRWTRTAPDEVELETTKVEDALFKLGGVEVETFIDEPGPLADYGLDDPVFRVEVRAKTDSWVELGREGDKTYARRSGDDAVLQVDSGKADELIEALTALSEAKDEGQPAAEEETE